MIKKTVLVFLILILFVVFFPASSYAGPQLPPTAEGPGFILPDSPLFFLDRLKQEVRLALALSLQAKAQVYNSIAGERFAELRFMLNTGNQKGIAVALDGVEENTGLAADKLSDSQFKGENVEKLSEAINTDIKRRQEGLSVLLASATGKLQTRVLGTQTSIYESKAKVVNGIAPHKIENEIKNDQNKQTETKILSGAECSRDILNKLVHLKQRIDQVSSIDASKGLRGTPPAKETRPAINEEKKKLLTLAYEKLIKSAKQCVEAHSAFITAYKEFNQLLSVKPLRPSVPTPSPFPSPFQK